MFKKKKKYGPEPVVKPWRQSLQEEGEWGGMPSDVSQDSLWMRAIEWECGIPQVMLELPMSPAPVTNVRV